MRCPHEAPATLMQTTHPWLSSAELPGVYPDAGWPRQHHHQLHDDQAGTKWPTPAYVVLTSGAGRGPWIHQSQLPRQGSSDPSAHAPGQAGL